MIVWPSFAALAVLAFIGPVLAQNSPDVMMPGVYSRSSSIDMTMRRPRPVRVRITPGPYVRPTPIYFPINLHNMYNLATSAPPPTENRETETRKTPAMVMTDDMDIDKMDLGKLRMMNSISTMEEFAYMLGIEMPVAANDSDNGIAARFGSGGTEVKLNQAICKPEETTVELNITAELNVVYIPSCVRLQRCGGCCHGSILKCRPTKTEAINIKVMRVASSTTTRTRSTGPERRRERPGGSGRDASSRRRRQTVAELITVPEEQHVECDCLCRVQEKDCKPALQEYMPDNCKCQCLNRDEEEKCAAKTTTHYWDDDQCTCFCLKTSSCSNTLRFDHTTCSCVHVPLPNEGSANNLRAGFVVNNAQEEESGRFGGNRDRITFGADGRL